MIPGVILAGGQSRRFGSDKALYELDGNIMIHRVHQAIRNVAHPVCVSVSSQGIRYPIDAKHLADTYPDAGPLGGIYTALSQIDPGWLLVVAVDVPYLQPDDVQRLLAARTPSTDIVVAASDGRIQPLAGCYHSRLAPAMKAWLQEGRRAVMPFIESFQVTRVALPSTSLVNVNTPP